MTKHLITLTGLFFAVTLSTQAFIASSPDAISPINVGTVIPDATLTQLDGNTVNLSDLTAGTNSVLIFFRGGWCPYCTKHLAALKDVLPVLQEQGFQIVAISPDTIASSQDAVDKHELPFTVVSDANFSAIEAFGLAFQLDTTTLALYKGYGISLVEHPQTGAFILPVPAVYIVDDTGTVRYRYYEPDYKIRLDPAVLLNEAAVVAGK